MSDTDVVYDLDDPTLLFRPDVLEDPAVLYAQLRREAPVWELPGTGVFVVTTAALIADAVARPEDFSSNITGLVFRGDDGHPAVFDMTDIGAAAQVLATADPPSHTRHRKLLQPTFSPGAVERLTSVVRGAARTLLDPLVSDGKGDFATLVADQLPVRIICRLIGIPDADIPALMPLVLQTNDLLAGVVDADGMANSATATLELTAYLAERLAGWRSAPDASEGAVCDVLARAVAAAEITGDEAVAILLQLMSAGTETTAGLIGRATLQLATDHAAQASLRDDPARIPTFLEEMLRLDGPFRFHYRSVARTADLGGTHIPAGSRLLLMWASANLDDEAFDHADAFDMNRAAPKGHFAFGRGIHFCIGAPLARLEGRVVLEELLARVATFSTDTARPVEFRQAIFLRRLATLPLVVDRA